MHIIRIWIEIVEGGVLVCLAGRGGYKQRGEGTRQRGRGTRKRGGGTRQRIRRNSTHCHTQCRRGATGRSNGRHGQHSVSSCLQRIRSQGWGVSELCKSFEFLFKMF